MPGLEPSRLEPFRPSCNSCSVRAEAAMASASRIASCGNTEPRMARGSAPRALRAAVAPAARGFFDNRRRQALGETVMRRLVECAIDANGAIIIEQRHERPRLVRGSLSRHGQQQRNARAPPSPKRRACRSRKNSSRVMTGSPEWFHAGVSRRRRNRVDQPSGWRPRAALSRGARDQAAAVRSSGNSSCASLVVATSLRSALRIAIRPNAAMDMTSAMNNAASEASHNR